MADSLTDKFGLNLLLHKLDNETHHCFECKKSTIHEQFRLPWKRKSVIEHQNIHVVEIREEVVCFKCRNCELTSLKRNLWNDHNDDFGDEQSRGNNMSRNADVCFSYPAGFSNEEELLIERIKEFLNADQLDYLYEVLANKSQGMKASAIIGFRSLFEHFFNITGTPSARDRFVSTCSKKRDGTTKTKNNFLYKLMWLQENGLLSRLQQDAIENMMRQGNVAVHRMESTDVNLNKAVEILYHLTVSYRMFDANQTK